MNQEQLESLPYPMFKTTEEEKECLVVALSLVQEEDYNYFLCHILDHQIGGDIACELKGKVFGSVKEDYTLSNHLKLGGHGDESLHVELRRIWIRKLLAYKPE